MAKLGEVFTLVRNGASIKQKDNAKGLPITRIETISNQYIDRSKFGYADIFDTDKYKDYILRNGDILMSHINSEKHLGKTAIYEPVDGEQIIHGMNLLMLRADASKIISKYAFYYFNSTAFFLQIKPIMKKSVNQASFTVSALKDLNILVPPVAKQKEIIVVLSNVESLISSCRQYLVKSNEFIKSRFIELFGDPYKNPFNWKRSTIANVMRAPASNGFFAKPSDYSENGNAEVIFVADVVNRKYSNIANLRKTTVSDRDLDKYRVQYGDMLFCRSSLVKEGIGKASVIPENAGKDIIFECHVIRIPLDMNVVIPEFMQALSVTNYFRNMMMSNSKTATMTTIGQEGIITAEIYIPPIELQKEFLLFNKQIDKSKLVIQKSLEKLEILKKSLMQQYFG